MIGLVTTFLIEDNFVVYNSAISPTESVTCGVPQGSILGPLLFILYMNDICQTSNLLKIILFADDTTIFYSHENTSVLCYKHRILWL